MLNSFSDMTLEEARRLYGKSFTIHGQGISACARSRDESVIPREEIYDWCCLYPSAGGSAPLDSPENFEYCISHGILPCVCVKDEAEAYRRYVDLGCRMFTTNDIREADRILRALGKR